MEKLSPNRAQLFLRNKYRVKFTMGGTVALRSVDKHFSGELYSSAARTIKTIDILKKYKCGMFHEQIFRSQQKKVRLIGMKRIYKALKHYQGNGT